MGGGGAARTSSVQGRGRRVVVDAGERRGRRANKRRVPPGCGGPRAIQHRSHQRRACRPPRIVRRHCSVSAPPARVAMVVPDGGRACAMGGGWARCCAVQLEGRRCLGDRWGQLAHLLRRRRMQGDTPTNARDAPQRDTSHTQRWACVRDVRSRCGRHHVFGGAVGVAGARHLASRHVMSLAPVWSTPAAPFLVLQEAAAEKLRLSNSRLRLRVAELEVHVTRRGRTLWLRLACLGGGGARGLCNAIPFQGQLPDACGCALGYCLRRPPPPPRQRPRKVCVPKILKFPAPLIHFILCQSKNFLTWVGRPRLARAPNTAPLPPPGGP